VHVGHYYRSAAESDVCGAGYGAAAGDFVAGVLGGVRFMGRIEEKGGGVEVYVDAVWMFCRTIPAWVVGRRRKIGFSFMKETEEEMEMEREREEFHI
jgi:hypothetical protein